MTRFRSLITRQLFFNYFLKSVIWLFSQFTVHSQKNCQIAVMTFLFNKKKTIQRVKFKTSVWKAVQRSKSKSCSEKYYVSLHNIYNCLFIISEWSKWVFRISINKIHLTLSNCNVPHLKMQNRCETNLTISLFIFSIHIIIWTHLLFIQQL